ncbi:ankyrin repeat domain-containing protein [Actinomadura viridis]|uniref:Cell wall assembly regulator SMI1 n=1 Tax=Actinomadura viridis TaxID=58110 RepID=A0A931GLK8_9ACTN|nr:ankyrin repeat domain-containing protein [Actinomadura viridis]MBG6092163.1 cell wall assembly regulator SMI1 [Actinomadura viridis]
MDSDQALLDAISSGDSAALTRLFADGADPATGNGDGDPVVLDAADTGKVELVRPFLDAGLPVDAESDLGTTPLMCAVSTGSLPLVEFLVSRGADVNRVQRGGVEPGTVLTWALELAEPLAIVSALLRAGADPDLPRPDGWTPLMLAAFHGYVEVIRALVAAGADVSASKDDGAVTPVGVAEEWRHGEAARVLRELGAPDPVESYTARLTVLVSGIAAWLAEHASVEYESLARARGAAAPEAVAALETAVGEPLPADFLAYLRLFGDSGGLDFYEYDGLSVAQILSRWRGLGDAHGRGTFDGWTPHELHPANGLVRCVWWHPGWVPFAADACGNLFCVDLAPAEHGRRGQVIQWETRGGPSGPRASSFMRYLRQHHDTLLNVQHTYDEEGRLERPC